MSFVELALIVLVISGLLAYLLTGLLVKRLTSAGWIVDDAHKPGRPKVPRPGGPAIIISILVSEFILYFVTSDVRIIAVSTSLAIAGVIGLVDDARTLGGTIKPLLLVLASAPILILGAYVPRPIFPLSHQVRLFIVYPVLILIGIPITANTINTIDVFNGAVTGFTFIATLPILIALALRGDQTMILATLPLLASLAAFYFYHKHPSRIFPGDSGTLAIGAMYGALAITGRVEIVGVIALLPAILNSFFFLSSVRRLMEHRKVTVRPTVLLDDYRLKASREHNAPVTLVRMILAEGPLSEKQITNRIFVLAIVAAVLSVVTALLTWGSA